MRHKLIVYITLWLLGFTSLFAKPNKLIVLTSTTIIYDITKNIAGDKVDVICLMPVGGDPHIYEPNSADAEKVVKSNLVLKNGLHLEGWLDELIVNAGGSRPIIEVTQGIPPILSVNFHSSPDPHAWMDPINGIIYAKNIAKALSNLDPTHAISYEENFKIFEKKLLILDKYIQTQFNKIPPKKRVLITSHDAFKYYGKRYKLKVEAALGTSTDAEVQIEDMNRLIKIIRDYNIPAIFVESTINPKLINQIAQDNGVVIGGSLFSDSLGDELSGAATYIDMLTQNTNTIVTALNTEFTNVNNTISFLPMFLVVGILFLIGFMILSIYIRKGKKVKLNWSQYTIELHDVSTSYDRKTVLSNINLSLESGKLYGLLGPNGAGKSTLFKSILGLVKPDSGEITINQRPIEEVRDKIAYIPQKEDIDWSFPATVIDIVITGRLPHKKQFETYTLSDEEIAYDALEKVGMLEFKDRQISDLSGGQQQRVFIARALCEEAEILMFDEPFVGVDVNTEEKIVTLIKNLVKEKKTVLIIHHDLSKVKDYFDAVIMINQRLIAAGETESTFTNVNIAATYGGRLTILQEVDKFLD